MGNVFRSKEVYAFQRNRIHDGKEIIPVRGVYVSGEYKPPYYNEPCINLTSIAPIKAIIVDFTEKYEEVPTTICCGFVEMDQNDDDRGYQVYGKTYESVPTTLCCGFVEMDQNDDERGYYVYGKTYESVPTTLCCGFVEMDQNDDDRGYALYPSTKNNSTPEPILHLTGITSDEAVITDYIP